MADEVTYRPIQSQDFSSLAKIIEKTWYDGDWDQSKVPYLLSLHYLYHTLTRHDFSKVALKNGKPVGVILAKGKHSPIVNKRFAFHSFIQIIKLLCYKEGREGIREARTEEAIDSYLLKETGESFEGELILFIVGEDARGLGVGSSLFRQFLVYQSSIETENYFLFTDDACSISFYDRKGLDCVGSYDDEGFHYYIYKGTSEKS